MRFVTAASLFDGHDASINIMRRILQSRGAEVIHLGHDRSAFEIAEAAIEEDAHAVAVTSYQGGHMEFFRYLRRLLDEARALLGYRPGKRDEDAVRTYGHICIDEAQDLSPMELRMVARRSGLIVSGITITAG